MRRKTIGRNPLDRLSAPASKGRKKKALPAAPEVQSEIREAILEGPEKGGVVGWLGSVLKGLTS